MDSTQTRNLAIHSILIFVLAFILNTTIHEGGHALMGKLFGLTTILYHNYVSTEGEDTASLIVRIMVPAAGPLMSIIQGIVFLILLRSSNKKGLLSLFYLWMSVMGFVNIGGYLMMTPIFEYGDTGKVFSLLNSPEWLKWLVAGLALFVLIKMIYGFTEDFENQVPQSPKDQQYVPGRIANSLILYPVLIGCAATTLLSLPVPSFLSMLYPATSPFITFMVYGKLRRKGEALKGAALYPDKISLPLIVITVIAIGVTRFLVSGFSL